MTEQLVRGGPSIARIADAVRSARHRRGWAGRLACVIAECPTCHAERGDSCRALDVDALSIAVHATRAARAADRIERAP